MAESGGGVKKFFCATVFMRDFFFTFDNGEEKIRENTRSSEKKNSKDKITPFPIKVTIYGDEAGGKQRSTRVTDAKYARNA